MQISLLIQTRTLFHWWMHYYGLWTHILAGNNGLNLKNTRFLSSQDVNWWTGVVWITCGLLWCFYQLFGLSFWRHPFTEEHPLMSKWCNDTFLQIWWRNKVIYILDDLRMSTFSERTIPSRVTPPQNDNVVINHLPPCRSKPVKALFVFGTQFKIFWMKTGRLVTVPLTAK